MDAKFVLKIFTVLFDNAEFLSFGSFSFFACKTKKENEHKKKRQTMQVKEFWCVKTHPTFYSKDCFVNSILTFCNIYCLAKTCCHSELDSESQDCGINSG